MPRYESYDEARTQFEWDLPEEYNPAVDFLRKHDDPDRTALYQKFPDGRTETYSFRDLDVRSNRLAAAFEELGVEPGDRVGVVVPQRSENPTTHLANWKVGAVSVPLTVLFGRDALEYRLKDSGATAVVVDASVRDEIDAIRDDCPDLEHVVVVGGDASGDVHDFEELLADRPESYDAYESTPDTSTAIMYTSGSTGPPKGVLHSHALWLGRAAAAYNYFDQGLDEDAVLWTPADWAWGAALGGTLFAAWHHGSAVVGFPRKGFDADETFSLLEEFGVTKAFLPPTALRMLMDVDDPSARYDLDLETIASVGEPLTPEIVEWVDEAFEGVPVNEFYGQTELNLVVGNSSTWFETRPGSMGKVFPGYDVAIVDSDTGEHLETGEIGEIALRPHDDSVFFDEYWNKPEKTAAKQLDGWYTTDDLAEMDEEGYLWFKSRADDVILTSGYRVGPTEVERAILEHPAIQQAGVVGVPDETRGEIIRAFVEPVGEVDDPDRLRDEIQQTVRDRLAQYEYPREIEFVDELPQTSTGKIQRRKLREQADEAE